MIPRAIETDVLVIGGGGAGFRAAIGAREKGARTLLVSKGPLARCGATPMAGADFTLDGRSLRELGFFGEPRDSREKFFHDMVTQGHYLNNQKLAEQYIQGAPERLRELMELGIGIRLSEERAIFTSGIDIMDALLRWARRIGVETLEDAMMLDLLVRDRRVAGALGLDIRTGEFFHIRAKAVVMATGGWHKAFWPNTGMRDLSGEGIAMAQRAGADVGNMEFITFCCNVLYEPPVWRGSIATYVMHMLCGGLLTNGKGEAFLEKYDPYVVQKASTMEWNKSFISFASAREVREGKGTPSGGIHYSRGQVPWEAMEPNALRLFPNWKYKAMDLSELARKFRENEPVEVGPAVEYFEGGIVINERFETTLEGLYAAGECSLGPFGANRVFAAITEMLVHGADAGRNAAAHAGSAPRSDPEGREIQRLVEKAEAPLRRKGGISPAGIRREMQRRAHANLGPIRNQEELSGFVEYLESLKADVFPGLAATSQNPAYNKEWIDALETQNMVQLLETSAKSALMRTESRGVHYREDFPETDNDNWLLESIASYENGDIRVSNRPITTTSISPPRGVVPYLEMTKQMMEAHSDVGGHH